MGPLFQGLFDWMLKPGNAQATGKFLGDLFSDDGTDTVPKVPKPKPALPTFSLAVLGDSEVGKTTLINSWRGIDPSNVPGRTHTPEKYGDVSKLTNLGMVTLARVEDVGGKDNHLPHWDRLLKQGRWVLYLINADRLYKRGVWPLKGRYRLSQDAERISGLIREREVDDSIPEVGIIVVVTHTDLDPRRRKKSEDEYEDVVREQLKNVIYMLGGDARVRLVTGSLVDMAQADRLTDRISAHLLKWAP